MIDAVNILGLINKHRSDYYYKAFKTRAHLTTMRSGILSRCDSMTEICEGLRAFGGKSNHLGLDKAPAKSTACDGLRNGDSVFFEEEKSVTKMNIVLWKPFHKLFKKIKQNFQLHYFYGLSENAIRKQV